MTWEQLTDSERAEWLRRAKLTQPLVVRMFGPRMTHLRYEGEGRAMLLLYTPNGQKQEIGLVNLEP